MKLNNSKFKIYNSTLLFLLASTLLLLSSCDTTNPPSNQKITLTAEDASCTEAWVNLKLKSVTLPTELQFFRNDSLITTTNINSNDTTFFIEDLLPNQTYTFKAYLTKERLLSEAEITTMDTTSHNFTWETFTFDKLAGSSVLNDIAIIDENDIWVVGEIYMYDSLGNPDPKVYNAVHWDGNTWELKRIVWDGHVSKLRTILAFNKNDIWFGNVNLFHWNGSVFEQIDIPNNVFFQRQNAIWGTSSKDFYVVGNGGNIAHYNGESWSKIESGTELDIQDICGIENTNDGKTEIFCTAVDFFSNDAKIIKVINNNEIEIINTNVGYIYSFWTQNGIDFYLCGNKLYRNKIENWEEVELDTSSPIIGISGNDYNDICIIGANRFFSHFNGITWYTYPKSNFSTLSEYTVIANTTNTIVAGGTSNSKVEIIVGNK